MPPARATGRPADTIAAAPAWLWFGILGPLQIFGNEIPLDPGPRKQQLALAVLLCNANRPVPVDLLIDSLWENRPPRTARKNLQVYISALRGMLSATSSRPRIIYNMSGYTLTADEHELDWLQFEQRVREGERLERGEQTAGVIEKFREALALWRGPALEGLHDTTAIFETVQRLENRFLAVFEHWAELELEGGASLDVAERIAAVAERHPFRERLRLAQMTALGQVGRRTEALAVFDEVRRSLASEFGLAPSAALTELHRSLVSEQARHVQSSAQILRRPAKRCLLPNEDPAFAGRGELTRELVGALARADERLAVITGPVGAGKTALAVHAAHLMRERFPDGCYFVRLSQDDGSPRPVAEIMSQLLWAVGVPSSLHGSDSTKLWASWQRWLAGHRALIVLDKGRRESEIRPLLPEAGESTAIITAWSRLAGLGRGHRVTVPLFSESEALELLRRIIGSQRVDGDESSAARIVAAVGLLPLAVQVIGEKLAGLAHVPLKEYLKRIEGVPNLLDELTIGDVSVRARLAEAMADLPAATDAALRHLGALPEACFTLSEATTALNAGEEAVLRTLESLLEANLVAAPDAETVAHDVVYEMPVLIHAYARELAYGAGIDAPEAVSQSAPGRSKP